MSGAIVTVIKHAPHEGLGNFEDAFARLGCTLDVIDAWRADDAAFARAEEAAALVVMGGPMGVYEADRFAFLARELALLKTRVARDRPTLGVCLGSQLIAQACGARVRASGRQEIGWYAVHPTTAGETDPLTVGLDWTCPVFHWHGDTFDLPPGASHLLSTERFEQQGFRVGRMVYGLQFHPEVPESDLPAWLESEPGLGYGQVDGIASREAILQGGAQHAAAMASLSQTLVSRLVTEIWRDEIRL